MRDRKRFIMSDCNNFSVDKFGKIIPFEEIKCTCGHRLMDVEVRSGSIIRIKCEHCKKIVRITV